MYHRFFDTTFAYSQDPHRELHERVHILHPQEAPPTGFEVFPITETPCSMSLLYAPIADHGLPLGSMYDKSLVQETIMNR